MRRSSPRRRAFNRVLGVLIPLLLGVPGLAAILTATPDLLVARPPDRAPLLLYLGGSLAVLVASIVAIRASHASWMTPAEPRIRGGEHSTTRSHRPGWIAVAACGAALALAGAAGYLAYGRTIVEHTTDISLLWLSGVAIVVVLALAGRGSTRHGAPEQAGSRLRWERRPPVWTWPAALATAGIVTLTIVTRFWNHSRFPSASAHDEWFFIISARVFRERLMPNPYRTLDVVVQSDVWSWLDGAISRPFPDEPSSYRILGGLVGILVVVATMLLARRTLGTRVALAGGMIVTTMPALLWASRTAMANILDPLVLVAALWLAHCTLETRDRRDALACGIVLGVGYYGYFGARSFPFIIAICMLAMLFQRPFFHAVRDYTRLGLWMLAGFAVTAAPMLAYAASNPDEFFERVNAMTEAVSGSHPTLGDRLTLVIGGLAYPLSIPRGLSIHAVTTPVNMLGSIASVFLGIGVLGWIAAVLMNARGQRAAQAVIRPGILLIAWLLVTIPVSQTFGMESHRLLAITPLWALAVASGIVTVGRGIGGLAGSTRLGTVATLVAVLAIGGQQLTYYFDESRQQDMWGDSSATLAYDLGWRFHTAPADTEVFVLAWEDVQFDWAPAIRYWAPDAVQHTTYLTDFSETTPPFGAPVLRPGQILILGPNHLGSACDVREANPHAISGAGYDRYGNMLYIAFSGDPEFPFRLEETPAESTFRPITPTCG